MEKESELWETSSLVPDPLEGLAFFDRIAALQSVSAAARYLDIPRATLSRRLSELEASLGVQLFHRTTRKLTLTAAGRELFSRTRRLLEDAEAARDAVRRLDGVPRGTGRISVPGSTLAVESTVHQSLETYPETRVEVIVTPRFFDLKTKGFDLALRAGSVEDPGLVAHPLGETALFPVASPDYLRRRGVPRSLEDLAHHECLLNLDGLGRPRNEWVTRTGESVTVRGRLVSNYIHLLFESALLGKGIALLPALLTAEALGDGRLIPVLDDHLMSSSKIALVHPYTELVEPRVRAFIDLAKPLISEAISREKGLYHRACQERVNISFTSPDRFL